MKWTERDQQEAFIKAILKAELQSLCEQAIHARQQIEDSLEVRRSTRTWFAVQGALVVTANASKLLWGKGADRAREALRVEAGVTDDSPLQPRHIRNSFEHIDERIIKWAERSGSYYVERHVIWDGERSPAGSQFGTFDKETWTVDFLDEKPISLIVLLDALDEIGRRLHPFPSRA